MPNHDTIGILSRESGVKVETIRYYERSGLLSPPARTASGYRRYGEEDIKRLRFIRRGRELGFGMGEIKTLLQLADQPQHPCHEADQMVQAHLTEIDAKIRDLQAIREVLGQLAGCQSQTAEHCYLLETLDQRVCCLPED
jgi:Hg(II)-responsive transcriptional regulator